MNVFRNNYKRLVQENKYEMAEMAKISVRNFRELNSMMEYLETYNLSLFELEVVKKDMIGMAKEASLEGLSFSDQIGMPQKEFCDSLIKDGIKQSCFERFIPLVRDLVIVDWVLYTLHWLIEGTPESFGFSMEFIWVNLMFCAWEFFVMSKLQRKKMISIMAGKKKEGWYSFLIVLVIMVFVMSGLFPTVGFWEFVVRGKGSVIFFILSALSFAAVIGNNYYWNKCSEKYDWR